MLGVFLSSGGLMGFSWFMSTGGALRKAEMQQKDKETWRWQMLLHSPWHPPGGPITHFDILLKIIFAKTCPDFAYVVAQHLKI